MSKRSILRAAKLKGLEIVRAEWGWEPTPGESVPAWSITVSDDSTDAFDIDPFIQFANTGEVLEWIKDLERVPAETVGAHHE